MTRQVAPYIFCDRARDREFVIVPHYDSVNDCYYVTSYVHQRCDDLKKMQQVKVGAENLEDLKKLKEFEESVLKELNN